MPSTAHVEQVAPNKVPILTAGSVTPAILTDWENACEQYFIHKDVEKKNQVKFSVGGCQDRQQ